MEIKRVKLFVNDNAKSNDVSLDVKEKLLKNGFELVDTDYDLAIAVGGDGSFLRMVKATNFNSDCYYIGINAGTLGFAQEVAIDEIEKFIELLQDDKFKVEKIGVASIRIKSEDIDEKLYALNEVVVRDNLLNTTKLDVYVDDSLLENFVGDGLLVSTSFGSTAYNLSFGGSIVFNTFHSLQITPIAPLHSKVYKSLVNSIIVPDNMVVKMVPKKNNGNLIISTDGDNRIYEGVNSVEVVIKKTIKIIRMENYNFVQKINDKFLK